MARSLKFQSITYKILLTVGEFMFIPLEVAYYATFYPREFYTYRDIQSIISVRNERLSRQQIHRGMHDLKKRQFIVLNKEGLVVLTDKARQELLKYRLQTKQRSEWDGKWHMVVFDVPEATRGERDFLRQQLKQIGFCELQKSVWVFPFEVEHELQEFIKLCSVKLNGDIRFVTVEKMNKDNDLKKFFSLTKISST